MEITLNRQSFKKALGVFLVVALFFGMCSPAAPYLPKISFDVGAANVTDGNVTDGDIDIVEPVEPSGSVVESGRCGRNVTYKWYENGVVVISGTGPMYAEHEWDNYYYETYYSPFKYHYNLKHIIIEEGVTSIGGEVFSWCDSLVSVEIPGSVTSIGYSAFEGCSNLKRVIINDGVKTIGSYAFSWCDSLVSIEIPGSVKTIGSGAFSDCYNLKKAVIGYGVKSIGSTSFSFSSLASIEIPDSVISIGNGAFSHSDLVSVEIPDSVMSMGTHVFQYCRRLQSVRLPEGLGYIPNNTFVECDYLKTVNIPDSVKKIGDNAFFSCNRLENIIIPEGVETIGYYAFFNCDSFTDIKLPESVMLIENSAFRGCDAMVSIEMGGESVEDVINIKKDAFYNCLSLKSVTVLNHLDWYRGIDECGIPEEAIFYGYEDSGVEWMAYDNSSRFRVYCPHEDTEAVDALAFSCYSDGHEEGIRCNDCGRWVTGGEGILASHLDENADKICDRCAKAMPKWENFVGGNMETVNNRKYCDDKARAYFYDDGTLEVFGEGEVKKSWYGGGSESSYGGLFLDAKKLVIYEGITHIDSNCFKKFLYIEEVTLPSTVRYVSSGAFADCVRLSKIVVLNPEGGFSVDGTSTPKHTVIYGYSGSSAETHAKHWLLKFVPLDREHDHEFESKLTLKPTCSATGTEEYTCYCGESYTEVVPANSHFDINKDDNCDMCGVKLNAFDQPVKPDEDEDDGTAEAPEGDSGSAQEPEEEKNVFEKFFESLIEFFKNFANLFDYFKNMF